MKQPGSLSPNSSYSSKKKSTSSKQPKTVRETMNSFYQSYQWKKFREEQRKAVRAAHEKIVLDVYMMNKDNKAEDLYSFISDDKEYPMCEKHLREEMIIKRGNTLDHIKPIRDGGAKLNHNNVQFLCEKCHAIKSGQESAQNRD